MSDSSAPSISTIHTVTICGAGTMGHGIAQVSAAAGFQTRLYDVDANQLGDAREHIEKNLTKGVARGKITEATRQSAWTHLTTTSDFEAAVTDADIVIEAVPERLELKQQLLARAAQHVGPRCILATNTSSLSIATIASAVPQPERIIGTHFFNPVHIMKLLEVIVGPQTDEHILRTVYAFGERLGKECITIQDSPGFATSRLGLVIGLEAIRMVEQGVGSAEDIDKAMTLGYGFPMGPLRLTDLVGLDVRLHIAQSLSRALPDGAHFRPPSLLVEMVGAGKLGKKTGQGFYTW